MKSSMFTIMKKELARFFGDKRLVLSSVLLPGLMIYVMYTFMGSAMSKMYTVDEDYEYKVSAVNVPAVLEPMFEEAKFEIKEISEGELEENKAKITEKKEDLCMIFPVGFEADVAAYDSASGDEAPQVAIYYNSAETSSQTAYRMTIEMLDAYESGMINKFDVNTGESEAYDVATEKDATGSIFSSMLPMLLMIFLFSGCMSVAPDSIAGEKERGTMATLLVTPTKRSQIAIGKIIALAIIALLSGLSSTIGTLLSMPKLMAGAEGGMSVSVYGVMDYVLLAIVILSTVLLLIAAISIISAFAKTIKEAQSMIMPLMMVVMFIGITAMFGGGAASQLLSYLIPLYNSVQCMIAIFSFEIVPAHIAVTVVSNLVYTGIGIFALTKMFNSEKIIYTK